ncbi:hypothetical protein C7M61_004544 [Candidozyma pseudohaemuli]|uniref:Uncharacterized protein n=1 Tax=Candidozyma pseudohaemuli TaxID=418784 RepID=A0A2P7YHS8_9ASCO|nr:hypothetical protein C7M61_004544 [[Candida] pseudohaemulonii]PSK35507.1 hypothetical protein C7M61_004544 [[Candida] pseudohaemulonii]
MLFIEFIKRRATVINIVLLVLGLVGYLTCGGITYKAYTSIQSDEEWKKLDYFAYEKLVPNYSGNIDNIKSILQEYESIMSPKKFPNPMRFRKVDSDFGRILREGENFGRILREGEKLLNDTTANNFCDFDTVKSWNSYFIMVESGFDKMLIVMKRRQSISLYFTSSLLLEELEERMKQQCRKQIWESVQHSWRCDVSMNHRKEKLEKEESSQSNAWIFFMVFLQAFVLLMKNKRFLSILLGFYALAFFVCFIAGGCLQRQTPEAYLQKWLAEKELFNIGGAFIGAFTTGCVKLVSLEEKERKEKERQERERQERERQEREGREEEGRETPQN